VHLKKFEREVAESRVALDFCAPQIVTCNLVSYRGFHKFVQFGEHENCTPKNFQLPTATSRICETGIIK
jgi:hypothetical protein